MSPDIEQQPKDWIALQAEMDCQPWYIEWQDVPRSFDEEKAGKLYRFGPFPIRRAEETLSMMLSQAASRQMGLPLIAQLVKG